MKQNQTITSPIELARIRAALPTFLAELSRTDPETAISLLQDWGDGNKTIKRILDDTLDKLDSLNPTH